MQDADLVEIAARAMLNATRARAGLPPRELADLPESDVPHWLDDATAAIAAVRPHIEVRQRERDAEIADAHQIAWRRKQQAAKECDLRREYRDSETMSIAAVHIAAAIRAQPIARGEHREGEA